MQVMLSGTELQEAMIGAARKKLGIEAGAEVAVEAAIYTGDAQHDPLRCQACVSVTIVTRKVRRCEHVDPGHA